MSMVNRSDSGDDRRKRLDHEVQADPDIRGVNAGRRGRHNDQRLADGNDPARVEHVMNNGQRRGRR